MPVKMNDNEDRYQRFHRAKNALGWTIGRIARRLGVSRKALEEQLRRRSITEDRVRFVETLAGPLIEEE